jgi:uncharacterized protein YaiE (UPF0345 family)
MPVVQPGQYPKIGDSEPASQAQPNTHPRYFMTTEKIDNISVATKASVYFDGKCVSHGITFADGSKKSVGVILPSTLTFNTGAPEIMECTGGACEYKLAGSETWVKSSPGEKFSIPGNSKFDIRVADGSDAYHYICHFG